MSSGQGDIVVLAGVNGGGKSSIAGAALESRGGTFYNPDRPLGRTGPRGSRSGKPTPGPGIAIAAAGSSSVRSRRVQGYAFETTLGGRTMTRLLLEAVAKGRRVRIWYVGLASPELHIRRVRERVARGGHDVPDEKIRERWEGSRENLIRLMPHVAELVVHDNSATVALEEGARPVKLLHIRDDLRYVPPLEEVPAWAKPLVEAAIRLYASS